MKKNYTLIMFAFFVQIFFCQLKLDSTVILTSKSVLIYPEYSPNSCYTTGSYDKKYNAGNMLFVTDIFECNSYSSSYNIIEFYFNGKKNYIIDDEKDRNIFIIGEKSYKSSDIKKRFEKLSETEIDSVNVWAKNLSLRYIELLKKEARDKIFSKQKYGIAILKANPTEDYSMTGADFKIINFSKKTIKYITFNFYGKNAVNDRVGSNISRKGIGPIEELETGTWSFDAVWLTDIVQTLKLISVNIIYMDGTTKIVPITDNHWIDPDDLYTFDKLLEE